MEPAHPVKAASASVLIVHKKEDSDSPILGELEQELERAGYHTKTLDDTTTALSFVSKHPLKAIFVVDELEPDAHGDLFIVKLNSLPSHPPILSVPSQGQPHTRAYSGEPFYELAEQGYLPDVSLSYPLRPEEVR